MARKRILSNEQLREIKAKLERGERPEYLAVTYGVSYNTLRAAVKRLEKEEGESALQRTPREETVAGAESEVKRSPRTVESIVAQNRRNDEDTN